MNLAWKALLKRMKRARPSQSYGYVKVVELTKAGAPHLHIALRSPFFRQQWISRNWEDLTGDFVVDIRAIRNRRQLAAYLAKYLAKSTTTVAGRRKYSSTPRWMPALPVNRPDWIPSDAVWRFHLAATEEFINYANRYLITLDDHWYLDLEGDPTPHDGP